MRIVKETKSAKEIIDNAIEWANFRECTPLDPMDIFAVGEYFKIKIPTTFRHFVESENPNHAKLSGAEKSIMGTLDRIKNKIIKVTGDTQETRGRKKGDTVSPQAKFSYKVSARKRVLENGVCGGKDVKPVVQLSIKDGRFIARYDNAKLALIELGKPTNRSDIGACCKGTRNKQSAFGFAWKYEEDYLKTHNYDDMGRCE